MKATLVLVCVALCGILAAAEKEKIEFITADQVKAAWLKQLPAPRKMDRDYAKITRENQQKVAEIKSGKRDFEAKELAASYNKRKALEAGKTDLAAKYDEELARIAAEKAAAADLAQRQNETLKEQKKLDDIKRAIEGRD